jgi:hypothetical protein
LWFFGAIRGAFRGKTKAKSRTFNTVIFGPAIALARRNVWGNTSRGENCILYQPPPLLAPFSPQSTQVEFLSRMYSSATQIGMTATPKETKDISNIDYFGEPVYSYSLRDGIDDRFLAPYKVVCVDLDKDLAGWRPERGKRDKYGNESIPSANVFYNEYGHTIHCQAHLPKGYQLLTELLGPRRISPNTRYRLL